MQLSHVIIIVLVVSAILSASMAVLIWMRRKYTAAWPFVLLMCAFSIYSLGYALELTSLDASGMLFWLQIEYLGIPFIAPFWFMVSAECGGLEKILKKRILGLLFIVPVITIASNWTDRWHHLFYQTISVRTDGPFPTLLLSGSVFFWIHIIYANLIVLAGNILIFRSMFISPPQYRKQAAVLAAGSLIPWVGMVSYVAGFSPWNIDWTPLALCVTGLIFAWGLLRYHLLDLVPIAREKVLDTMSSVVLVLDNKNRIVDYNQAALKVFPMLNSRSIGIPISSCLDDLTGFLEWIEGNYSGSHDVLLEYKEEARSYQARMSGVKNRRGGLIGKTILLYDITTQVHLLEKLKMQATSDELTGINNRRHFFELGEKEIFRAGRYGRPLSLIMMDIDKFKHVNDNYGYQAGDEILRHAVKVCQECLRTTDIFGRYGGDEFAIMLPETDLETACSIAERLRTIIELSVFPYEEFGVKITASFGLSIYLEEKAQTLDQLIRLADDRLYQAKAAGRNCVRT